MKRSILLTLLLPFLICTNLLAQQGGFAVSGTIKDSAGVPLPGATVMLLKTADSSSLKITSTDNKGHFVLEDVPAGQFLLVVSATSYITLHHALPLLLAAHETGTLPLQRAPALLAGVTVISKKPLIEIKPDRTIINVDASVTNVGATALEVLEKSPGVTVDRNGTISLKGKQNVLVLMDGKQSYLSAADLASYLGGISAAQIDQIEIMTNPSAKYDAAGNAGIINIKTKKTRVKGFNGNLNLSYGQGRYYKSNNGLIMNYRNGNYNIYLNYNSNISQYYTDLYAMRWYYAADNKTVTSTFEQPTSLITPVSRHNFKTGIDYNLSKKTTIGFSVAGLHNNSKTSGNSSGEWRDAQQKVDSFISTVTNNKSTWKNIGLTVNAKHTFSANKELSADLDYLNYDLSNSQHYENTLTGLSSYTDGLRGQLPSTLRIFSGKVDYKQPIGKQLNLETGWKTSYIKTDNIADYEYLSGNNWKEDLSKTNHFLYKETIHAGYVNLEQALGRFTLQSGLRYEHTAYDAHQLGNAIRKDSAFSRQYKSLFPTVFMSYQADSAHSFTISVGRRIDRPAFQKLNPFVFLMNKYTYQKGNPYYRPQFTWNFEVSHQFKQYLITTLSYSITNDYFSQIFLSDSNDIIIYTEGNLGRMTNAGIAVSSQLAPASWWAVTLQANFNHKNINGVVVDALSASINQLTMNISNQFRFNKGWSAELSGYYITRNQNDLQEVLDPTGQVGVGVAKQIWKNKATIRLSMRDIFYTQKMAGLTSFQQATEYFWLKRDTRVATIAFNWRFGKPLKGTARKTNSAVDDIKERVGQ